MGGGETGLRRYPRARRPGRRGDHGAANQARPPPRGRWPRKTHHSGTDLTPDFEGFLRTTGSRHRAKARLELRRSSGEPARRPLPRPPQTSRIGGRWREIPADPRSKPAPSPGTTVGTRTPRSPGPFSHASVVVYLTIVLAFVPVVSVRRRVLPPHRRALIATGLPTR